ncbi:MAG: FAD-dependent monooxygenase [Saprospiraceae bacterium]|nr:FAD-dependent monooxygenase [Saprospiraceae bacterium]
MENCNVCIIGSGSAAFSAAITLAEKGIKTVLLKQEQGKATKKYFGETLSPNITPSMYEMGIQEPLQNIFLPTIENSISTWGSDSIDKKSSLFHPSGFGWLFKRYEFENILCKRLKETKAKIISSKIISVTKKATHWIITFDKVTISSDFIIIAVGRDKLSSFQLQTKASVDKLVSCIVSFKESNNHFDKSIYVDSSKNGWFYSMKNESSNRVINYFTDGDLLSRKDEKQHIEFLKKEIKSLPSLSDVVSLSDLNKIDFYKVVSANTTFRTSHFKEGVLVCGDTAQTYDPLSSQGITNAVKDGISLGNAISDYYDGNQNSFKEHEARRRSSFVEYLKNRHGIYSKEVRWRNNPFWERRHNIENLKSFLKKVEPK